MSDPRSVHVPVMLDEVLAGLNPRPGETWVDGTLGGGGHALAISECIGTTGRLIALDLDPGALERAEQLLAGRPITLAHENFCNLTDVLDLLDIPQVDGVLLDLGISSDQLADRERGFSFDSDGPLDLRFNPQDGEPASELLNRLGAERLADIIFQFGEERHSHRIARAIVEQRRIERIETAAQLAALVRRCLPRPRRGQRLDPATRTFQALRIAVNEELTSLAAALQRIPARLKPGGRFAVISFHSLEDRPVKEAFRGDARLENLTKKPIRPSIEEVERNPRARSAKLRLARRTDCD